MHVTAVDKEKFVLWIWMCLWGCAHRPVEGRAQIPDHMYQVRIEAEVGDVQLIQDESALRQSVLLTLDTVVSLTDVRLFRDGSVGKKAVFESAGLLKDGTVVEDFELAGRAVEMRTFPDGEILAIGWIEKAAGPGRMLDVFEIIFPALSPAAPSLRHNQEAKRRIFWPFVGQNQLRWESAVDAIWRNNGLRGEHGYDAWEIEYAGPWKIRGGRRGQSHAVRFIADGEAKGTVLFDRQTGHLMRHQLSWTRFVTVEGSAGPVSQNQSFQVLVERIP
jgi:hypothetical protein